jgi:hypothetical protein
MPSGTDARAAPREGPPRDDRAPGKVHDLSATVAQATDLAAWRERRAWLAAARHLNAAGYAAAAAAELVGYLGRRGLVVWAAGDRRTA